VASWFDVAGFSYQEFSAGGTRTFAVVEGQSGAFPLVLLHSIPGASFVWSTTIQVMGRKTRCIAPDFPGWGRSRNRMAVQKNELSRQILRHWLAEVIEAQQCAQCDLMGLGDGAWLATDYLLEHPEKVRRLGLLNLPLTGVSERKFKWPWQTADWTRSRLQEWLKNSGANTSHAEPMFQELFAGGRHAERSPEIPSDDFRQELAVYRDSLRRFEGETWLVWGESAAGVDPKLATEFALGRRAEIWQGAGNFPMWEQPERYTSEIRDFFGP